MPGFAATEQSSGLAPWLGERRVSQSTALRGANGTAMQRRGWTNRGLFHRCLI
jgi:hypothetical protein